MSPDRTPFADDELRRLLAVGRALVSELDLESVLDHVLQTAVELTNARYAALGILDESKDGLERFLHTGLDEEARRRIGPLPRGRGVLGELIRDPRPLRLADVTTHPRSYGFPPGHPPMATFLGVPITIRGEAYGNLYLAEKVGGGEFGEATSSWWWCLRTGPRSPSTTHGCTRESSAAARSSSAPSVGSRPPRRSRERWDSRQTWRGCSN